MKVLLGVDDSSFSAEAVRSVAERPWPTGTIIKVLSAVQHIVPPAAELGFDAGGSLQQVWELREQRAQELTSRIARKLGGKRVTAEAVVRHGDPRSVIVDEARQWGADLIVIGSHGLTGITRWLLGSVAESVVSHAPCSVEVVRAKHQKR